MPFLLHSLVLVAAAGTFAPAPEAAVAAGLDRDLTRALAVPGARVLAVGWASPLPSGCAPQSAQVARPITGSGRIAVRLSTSHCPRWAFLRVEVWAPVAITTRAVRAGEALDDAVHVEEREVRSGRPPWLPPPGAVASRNLPSGTSVEPQHVAGAALTAGTGIKVLVATGALAVEMQGRALACGEGRACAVLPSGRRVEGRLVDGRLLVEVP